MLALDESNDGDKVIKEGNYTFCIENDLLDKVGSVAIDFTYMGFTLTPSTPLAGGGSCSSGSCGGCSGH